MAPENPKHPPERTRTPADDEKARAEYEEYIARANARREALSALRGGSRSATHRRRRG